MEKYTKYPDGSGYVTISKESKDTTQEITFKINTYEDLWHLNQFVDVMNHNGRIPIITISNLIDAQADKRFSKNESSGLKLVCKFLNKMNANFKIFHPHNPEVVEALMGNVEIIDNSKFIQAVLEKLPDLKSIVDNNYNGLENIILMSSDADGFKPLMKLCRDINWKGGIYSATKYRDAENNKLNQFIGIGDFEGKDILIVDDISVYGGTFKGLSKILKERNCGKLYLAVSHMTVQELGDDSITNYFDKVFTTNSKFDDYKVKSKYGFIQPSNLEIIKLF